MRALLLSLILGAVLAVTLRADADLNAWLDAEAEALVSDMVILPEGGWPESEVVPADLFFRAQSMRLGSATLRLPYPNSVLGERRRDLLTRTEAEGLTAALRLEWHQFYTEWRALVLAP